MDLYSRKQQIDVSARDIERLVHIHEGGVDVLGCEAGSVLCQLQVSRRCHTVWVGVTTQAMESDPEPNEQG